MGRGANKWGLLTLAELHWPKGTRRQSLGFLIQLLARHIDRDMRALLDELGINQKFFETLMVLLSSGGISQRDLGQHLFLPEYQISRNLDAMAVEGLIERRPSPNSRRTLEIHLTEKGRGIAMELPKTIKSLNDKFMGELDAQEQETLVHLLQKVLVGSEQRAED